MRPIDPPLVDEAWREVMSYAPGRIDDEAKAFLAQQPHVAEFARMMTRERPPAVQTAALGLAFLLFKVLEKSVGRPFPPVRAERIAQAHEEVAEWLARSPTSAHAVLAASASAVHPSLALHILETFYGDATGPADYDEDVRAGLWLLLRTLTAALDLGAPDRR